MMALVKLNLNYYNHYKLEVFISNLANESPVKGIIGSRRGKMKNKRKFLKARQL